jgi:hypothetical protein
MDYIAVKDLKAPRMVRERLQREGELLLMNNGRPMALMIDVGADDNPETMIRAVRDARSAIALNRVREAARKSGASNMTLDQINQIVKRARSARRADR